MEKPKFSLQDIKYATDDAIFGRANKLFELGKVKNIKENPRDYSATVQGTSPYKVSLSKKDVLMSDCTCYMGKNDLLCKHVLALALAVLKLSGGSLQEESPKKNRNSRH